MIKINTKLKVLVVLLLVGLMFVQGASAAKVYLGSNTTCKDNVTVQVGSTYQKRTVLSNESYYDDDGMLDVVEQITDCAVYNDYSNNQTNMTIYSCVQVVDNATHQYAECQPEVQTAPDCYTSGESQTTYTSLYSSSEEPRWYDVCYMADQRPRLSLNGYKGCVGGNASLDLDGCIKKGTLSYKQNKCYTESQAKTCNVTQGWVCDVNDTVAAVDCNEYADYDISTRTTSVTNYRVSKNLCGVDSNYSMTCSGSGCCVAVPYTCDGDNSDDFAPGFPILVNNTYLYCIQDENGYYVADSPETPAISDNCTGQDYNNDGLIDNNVSYCYQSGDRMICDKYVPNYVDTTLNADTPDGVDSNDVCIKGEVQDCFISEDTMIGCNEGYTCLNGICYSEDDLRGAVFDVELPEWNDEIGTIRNLRAQLNNATGPELGGIIDLVFEDSTRPILETSVDFDNAILDFSGVELRTENCTEGYGWTIVTGLPNLPDNFTKNMYVDALADSNRVCARDAPTTRVEEISSGCAGEDEIYFDNCTTAGQSKVVDGREYTCTKVRTESSQPQYLITGLHHSGGVEVTGTDGGDGGDSVNIPEFNAASILMALALVTIGLLTIRRKNL
jgi:hypothetical protein